jgi:hypothetical protein
VAFAGDASGAAPVGAAAARPGRVPPQGLPGDADEAQDDQPEPAGEAEAATGTGVRGRGG